MEGITAVRMQEGGSSWQEDAIATMAALERRSSQSSLYEFPYRVPKVPSCSLWLTEGLAHGTLNNHLSVAHSNSLEPTLIFSPYSTHIKSLA